MKKRIYKLIWKIAGISPRMGNLVMDVCGYERYIRIAKERAR